MKLADREDLALFPPVLVALIARAFGAAALAGTLAYAAYLLSRTKRRRIEAALDSAFGGSLPPHEKRAVTLGSLRGVWDELFCLVARPRSGSCQIQGLEHLQASQAKGRGTILWESNGFGPRWTPKRRLRELGFAMHQVHGFNHLGGFETHDAEGSFLRARVLRPFFNRCESYFVGGFSFLPEDGALGILREFERRLARNEIICIAADGRLGQRSIELPFLGCVAKFSTGMVSLAKLSGADLLPIFCVADVLTIEAPIAISGEGGRESQARGALAQYARLLEAHVRRQPGEFRNWHLI